MKYRWLPAVLVLLAAVLACTMPGTPQAQAVTQTPAPTVTLIDSSAFVTSTPTETPVILVPNEQGTLVPVTPVSTLDPFQTTQKAQLDKVLAAVTEFEYADKKVVNAQTLYDQVFKPVVETHTFVPNTFEYVGINWGRNYYPGSAEGYVQWACFKMDEEERVTIGPFVTAILSNKNANPALWVVIVDPSDGTKFSFRLMYPTGQLPNDHILGMCVLPEGGPQN